jgi:integrase
MSKPQKRSGGYRIRWIDANGKRQSETFKTYELARSALRTRETGAEDDRERRERFGTESMTVSEAGEAFLANRKRDPNNTERRFLKLGRERRTDFETHIKPHIGPVKLCDLTPPVLRRWLETLMATKTARRGETNETGRTLSASRIRNITTTLRQIAKANDVPLVIMLADQLRQKRKRRKPKALQSIAEVRALLEACTDLWFKVAAAIACHCGARLGEVASLRWRDVGAEMVTIAMSWEGPLKARYEDDDDAARVVPLTAELAVILSEWRLVTKGRPNDRIVLVRGKRPMIEGRDDVAAKTRAACKRAQLTPLTFHQLRHTYGTILSDQGLPIGKLAALLGHADVKTTSIYINPESANAAMDPRARLGAKPEGLN